MLSRPESRSSISSPPLVWYKVGDVGCVCKQPPLSCVVSGPLGAVTTGGHPWNQKETMAISTPNVWNIYPVRGSLRGQLSFSFRRLITYLDTYYI